MAMFTLLVILITRLYLFIVWDSTLFADQRIDGWHHMYTGAILMFVSIFIPQKYSVVVLSIGLGLFLDELIHLFHMLGIVGEADYWSLTSIATTIIGYLVVVLLISLSKARISKPHRAFQHEPTGRAEP